MERETGLKVGSMVPSTLSCLGIDAALFAKSVSRLLFLVHNSFADFAVFENRKFSQLHYGNARENE